MKHVFNYHKSACADNARLLGPVGAAHKFDICALTFERICYSTKAVKSQVTINYTDLYKYLCSWLLRGCSPV